MPSNGLLWASATASKRGNQPAENEDASAVGPNVRRFAVADGASEGWQSRAWANRLSVSFVRHPPEPATFPQWLAAVRGGYTPPDAPTAETGGSWYSELKQAQGSYATLLGLELHPASGGGMKWKAVAVGDSCLLVVRGGGIHQSFPVETRDGFSNRTPLVPSQTDAKCPEPEWLAGRAEPGDLLILATDGLAAWLMARDDDAAPWGDLLAVLRESDATRRTERLLTLVRDSQAEHNDDITLVAVRVPPAAEAHHE
jgi:hypothetical protein